VLQDDAPNRRRTASDTNREIVLAEPARNPLRIRGELEPNDLLFSAGSTWERRSLRPLQEERKTRLGLRPLQACQSPAQELTAGRGARARGDGELESRRRRIERVGAYGPRKRLGATCTCACNPLTERASFGLLLIDDGDQLEIGIAEGNDPVGSAPVSVSSAGHGWQAETSLELGRGGLEPGNRDQDVVEFKPYDTSPTCGPCRDAQRSQRTLGRSAHCRAMPSARRLELAWATSICMPGFTGRSSKRAARAGSAQQFEWRPRDRPSAS